MTANGGACIYLPSIVLSFPQEIMILCCSHCRSLHCKTLYKSGGTIAARDKDMSLLVPYKCLSSKEPKPRILLAKESEKYSFPCS
jgi:hypothetical protein